MAIPTEELQKINPKIYDDINSNYFITSNNLEIVFFLLIFFENLPLKTIRCVLDLIFFIKI